MRVNLVFYLKTEAIPGYYREFTEVYEVSTSDQLETIYKRAQNWCNKENRVLDPKQDGKKPKWGWLVRYGEDEKNIDAMLLLQIVEVAEDVIDFWEENGGRAIKYEV